MGFNLGFKGLITSIQTTVLSYNKDSCIMNKVRGDNLVHLLELNVYPIIMTVP